MVDELQSLLTHPGVALAVLGPRRSGKSSLLRMLPVLVPSDVFVYVDLQSNTVDSPPAFYQALDKRLAEARQNVPDERIREALESLARDQAPTNWDGAIRRWMRLRGLINPEN